jgi:hypothetical protein
VALLRRRKELPLLGEDDVRARSYGERSEDVMNVKPMERAETPQEPPPADVKERLSDRTLRAAFLARLDRRDGA